MDTTFLGAAALADDLAWAERCEYWSAIPADKKRHGRPPRHSNRPLILTGHGVRLKLDQGCLLVKNGFTHYPQPVEEHRFFPADRQKPARIIIIDGNGSITLDVLSWLTTHNIPLVRLDWRGNVTTVLSNNYGPDHKLVHRQLQAQARALPISISLILQKLKNCIATLQTLPSNERVQAAITKIGADIKELIRAPPKTLKALRGVEGRSALFYFSAWRQTPIKWKGLGRRPIPADWHQIGPRTSANSVKGYNRDASHPVNAILNYAYGVLESHLRTDIISQGYDPTIGYLHAFEKYRAALVFDLMEPMRPLVDQTVLAFAQSNTFQRTDFTITADGVCRLNPELARHLVGLLGSLCAEPVPIFGVIDR
jgi:CRISP-associated protein Cas1